MQQAVWPDGSAVVVFVLPEDNEAHKNFLKNELHLFHYQLERSWKKLTFSGMGQRPILVLSQEEMLRKVSQTPGAIGYLESGFSVIDVKEVSIEKG